MTKFRIYIDEVRNADLESSKNMALCCLEWVKEYYHTPKALNSKAEGCAARYPRLVIITIENPEGVRQEWEQHVTIVSADLFAHRFLYQKQTTLFDG